MYVMLFFLGAVGMITQVSFLREIIAVFRGGELTIGTALFFWLFWTSLGSMFPPHFSRTTHAPDRLLQRIFPWYTLIGFIGYCAIGFLPVLFGTVPGEHVSYDLQILVIAFVYAPFNYIGGVLFALGTRAMSPSVENAAGTAYTFEAAGAALAGTIASLILIPLISNAMLAGIAPFIGAVIPALLDRQRSKPSLIALSAVIIVCICCGLNLLSFADGYRYRGQTILEQSDTRFGRLTVTSHAEQTTIYSGPSMLVSLPDRETHEYAAHIPLLAHQKPEHVLVLGGSPGGITDEILRHPSVISITCVELDPMLFSISKRYLGDHWNDDPRIDIEVADGRSFMAATAKRFDVIIMQMPPPLTGAVNRYYTREFFRKAASVLKSDGIISFVLTGEENYLGDDLAEFLATVRTTLGEVFPSITMLPGSTTRVIAALSNSGPQPLTWELLENRRINRDIETRHIRDYHFPTLFSPFRLAMMNDALNTVENPDVNCDFAPVGLWKRTIVQGEIEQSRLIKLLKRLTHRSTLYLAAISTCMLLMALMIPPGRTKRQRRALAAIMSVGMTEISLEIIAIMAYQSVFGFLYGRIALLTGAYMAGLAFGGFISIRRQLNTERTTPAVYLSGIQAGIALVAAGWLLIITCGEYCVLRTALIESVFFVLTALAGLTGGMQFPEADRFFRLNSRTRRSTGTVYGADLFGSSFGALITGSLMVPLLGMKITLVFLIILNMAIASVFFATRNT